MENSNMELSNLNEEDNALENNNQENPNPAFGLGLSDKAKDGENPAFKGVKIKPIDDSFYAKYAVNKNSPSENVLSYANLNFKEYTPSNPEEEKIKTNIENSQLGKNLGLKNSINPVDILGVRDLKTTMQWWHSISRTTYNMIGAIPEGIGASIGFIGQLSDRLGALITGKEYVYDPNSESQGAATFYTNLGEGIRNLGKKVSPDLLTEEEKNAITPLNVSNKNWWIQEGGAVEGIGSSLEYLPTSIAWAKVASKAMSKLAVAATGAAIMRNQENFKEGFDGYIQAKQTLDDEFKNNPEFNTDDKIYNKFVNTDIGKELINQGKIVNAENVKNLLASRVFRENYKVSSANIAFDMLQMIPIVKMFDKTPRIGKFRTANAVKNTNKGLDTKFYQKLGDFVNPYTNPIPYGSLGEGIEEVVNAEGERRGRNIINRALGKQEEEINKGEYAENFVLGAAGGLLFSSVELFNNDERGTKGRIEEIQNRENKITALAKNINEINADNSLSDFEKKQKISMLKSVSDYDMGSRVMQSGNGDLYLEWLSQENTAKKFTDLGISDKENVDKVLAKMKENYLLQEKLTEKHNNLVENIDADDYIKEDLASENAFNDYIIEKNKQQIGNLSTDVVSAIKDTEIENLNTKLEYNSLKVIKNSLEKSLNSEKLNDNVKKQLTKRVKEVNNKLEEYEKSGISLTLDPSIKNSTTFDKVVETKKLEVINNNLNEEIKYNLSPEGVKSYKDNINKVKEKIKENAQKQENKKEEKPEEPIKQNTSVKEEDLQRPQTKQEKEKQEDFIPKEKEQENALPVITPETVKNENVKQSKELFSEHPEYEKQEFDNNAIPLQEGQKQQVDEDLSKGVVNPNLLTDEFLNRRTTKNLAIYARNRVQEEREKVRNKKQAENERKSEKEAEDLLQAEDKNIISPSTFIKEQQLNKDSFNIEDESSGDDNNNVDEFLLFSKNVENEGLTFRPSSIPLFKHDLQNVRMTNKGYSYKDGKIIINKDNSELAKLLLNGLNIGDEVDLEWDFKNTFLEDFVKNGKKEEDIAYRKSRTPQEIDLYNTAIKISKNGVFITFLPTEAGMLYNIKNAQENSDKNPNDLSKQLKVVELKQELEAVLTLRKQLNLNKEIDKKIKVAKIQGAKVVTTTKKRSIKGLGEGLYYLNPRDTEDRNRLYSIKDENSFIVNSNKLQQGAIYLAVKHPDGRLIPTRTTQINIPQQQAIIVKDGLLKMLDLLNDGKGFTDTQVKNLREELSKIINIDSFDYFAPIKSIKINPKSQNAEGKTIKPRIEINYNVGEKYRTLVLIKNEDGSYYLASFTMPDAEGKREKTKDFHSIHDEGGQERLEEILTAVIKTKRHNVNIKGLKNNQEFKLGNKTYDNYLKYLEDEDIIQTDLTGVYDNKGEFISNFFGFSNSFSLYFDINNEKPEIKNIENNNSSVSIETTTPIENQETENNEKIEKASDINDADIQELFSKNVSKDNNEVYQGLKSIDILESQKATDWFKKRDKANWTGDLFYNKLSSELNIPKEQVEIIKSLDVQNPYNREELLISLLADYSYSVEINNSKTKLPALYGVPEIEENTDYYSNLTVPGGTNYTENEIATPAITPSIKGHAQFSTDNGIGWFRSDEQKIGFRKIKSISEIPNNINIFSYNKPYYEDTTTVEKINGKWIDNYTKQEVSHKELIDGWNSDFSTKNLVGEDFGEKTKTRRILEVQSDLFQKGRDRLNDLTNDDWDEEGNYLNGGSRGKFLELLGKDNNWVTFFVKSIIQDSAKKGYEKVLFPKGDTASKIEGHTTLEEFKKQKEDRIKELELQKSKIEQSKGFVVYDKETTSGIVKGRFDTKEEAEKFIKNSGRKEYDILEQGEYNGIETTGTGLSSINAEINQLKQELERVEKEGFGALKPIYNFYENTVTNILNKQFGKENIKKITDEYGNTWNGVEIKPEHLDKILFSKYLDNPLYNHNNKIVNEIKRDIQNNESQIRKKEELVVNGNINTAAFEKINKELQELYENRKKYEKQLNRFKIKDFKENYEVFRQGQTSGLNALQEILQADSLSPVIKTVAEFYKSVNFIHDTKIQLSKLKKNERANYNPKNNIIKINEDYAFENEQELQAAILHELNHAIVVKKLIESLVDIQSWEYLSDLRSSKYINPYLVFDNLKFKDNTPEYVKQFLWDIINLRNEIIAQYKQEGKDYELEYGLHSPIEFIAEISTNNKFRETVSSLNPSVNFIEDFYNIKNQFIKSIVRHNKYEEEKIDLALESTKVINDFINTLNKEKENIDDRIIDLFGYNTLLKSVNINTLEKYDIVNSLTGIVANITYQNNLTSTNEKIKSSVLNGLQKHYDNLTDEVQKVQVKQIIDNFDYFYDLVNTKLNTYINFDLDKNDDLKETNQEDWDGEKDFTTQVKNTLSKELKLALLGLNEFDENKNVKTSQFTGIKSYVNVDKFLPFLFKNFVGLKNDKVLFKKLAELGQSNNIFNQLSDRLKKDNRLKAQFKSLISNKTIIKSYIGLYNDVQDEKRGDRKVVRLIDELKNSKYETRLKNEWVNKTEELIEDLHEKTENGLLKNKESLEKFKDKISKINNNIISLTKTEEDYKKNYYELANEVVDFGQSLNIDLDYKSLEDFIKQNSFVNFNKNYLIPLKQVAKNVYEGITKNSNGNLSVLAKNEAINRYDIVENNGLDVNGNIVSSIVNPSMLTDWFDTLKAAFKKDNNGNLEDEIERNNFDEWVENQLKISENQFSSWLWNYKEVEGLVEAEFDNVNKVLKAKRDKNGKIIYNENFINNFYIGYFNGIKNTDTNNTAKYTQMSEEDYMLNNLYNFLNINDKSKHNKTDYCLIPFVIPSDAGKISYLNVRKLKLEKGITFSENGKIENINKNNVLIKSVGNVAKKEVRRIRRELQKLFLLQGNKLIVKDNINFNELQQYYHYKKIEYNKDGSINIEKTLLDKGVPTGNAFKFNSMVIVENKVFKTLSDKLNLYELYDTLSQENIKTIEDFTNTFITQQINNAYQQYKKYSDLFLDKHNNISDGSFKGLIAEYILNHFVNNNEMFNYFIGDPSEFKSLIDTNKRAKIEQTTGTKLDNEITKGFVYENGSVSDGQTARLVTIADVERPSTTLKEKEEVVKKWLKENAGEVNENKVNEILKPYKNINSGDGAGYCSLDRWEILMRKSGQITPTHERLLKKIRAGEKLDLNDYVLIIPIKGIYNRRGYDSENNKNTTNQLKYASYPTFPQLVEGTELEKLMNFMNKNAIDEVVFESAHKVGAKRIYKIHNDDGTINENSFKDIIPETIYDDYYKLQLNVDEHILDEYNLFARQISKIILSNLSEKSKFVINGKEYTKYDLIEKYFNTWDEKIKLSAQNLLIELGVKINEKGELIADNYKVAEILKKEIQNRGLGNNYNYITDYKNGQFRFPLWFSPVSNKFESVLTSLFTNNVTKQKSSGFTAVLMPNTFLNKSSDKEGIKWSKEKENNKTLNLVFKDGYFEAEVLVGGWNKNLYNNGELMNIDDIPDEIKTMIGYRIPYTSKAYSIRFKVVGFLPESAKAAMIVPDDLVVQMGQDFDIDKWFVMSREFYKDKQGKLISYRENSLKNEYESLKKELEEYDDIRLYDNDGTRLSKYFEKSNFGEAIKEKGLKDLQKEYENELIEKRNRYQKLISENTKYNDEGILEWITKKSKEELNNSLHDIIESILSNPEQQFEILSPSDFPNAKKVVKKLENIYGTSETLLNVMTEYGQRQFMIKNTEAKTLLGIAANLNAFVSVAQVCEMYVKDGVFNFIYDGKEYDNVYIGGKKEDNYLNVDKELVTQNSQESVIFIVDNAKNPMTDKLNLSTLTYPVYHVALSLGHNTDMVGMFITQPILKDLNIQFKNANGIINNNDGNYTKLVKRNYQTKLYELLKKTGKIDEIKNENKNPKITEIIKATDKKLKTKNKLKINDDTNTSYMIFVEDDLVKDLLNYDVENEKITIDYLEKNHKINKSKKDFSDDELIDFYKSQLVVLNKFEKMKQVADSVNNLAINSKFDALGAGQKLEITEKAEKEISSLERDRNVLINDEPAIKYLISDDSKFSPLYTYFNYSNRLSYQLLKDYFISYSQTVYNLKQAIANKDVKLTDDFNNGITKFFNYMVINNFPEFAFLDKKKILGIGAEINQNINIKYEDFELLSTANKLAILKNKYKDSVVFQILTPKITKSDIKANGYHSIEVQFYKDENIDNLLSEELLNWHNSENPFKVDFVNSLIQYSVISNGLSYGLNSFSKILPPQVLEKLGLNDYLYRVQEENFAIDDNIIDTFYRNNWRNRQIVPNVKTKYYYITNELGQRVKSIKFDSNTNREVEKTKNNTPIWSPVNGYIRVQTKQLNNTKSFTKNSPYILFDNKLYKKYKLDNSTSFDGYTYYYEVNKLGKAGIMEFSDKSVFAENNTSHNSNVLEANLSVMINKIIEQQNKAETENINEEEKEKIINNCNIKP